MDQPNGKERPSPRLVSKVNITIFTAMQMSSKTPKIHDECVLRFTVEPFKRLRVKPWPAGTVKLLMFTVVHLTALSTSVGEVHLQWGRSSAGFANKFLTIERGDSPYAAARSRGRGSRAGRFSRASGGLRSSSGGLSGRARGRTACPWDTLAVV